MPTWTKLQTPLTPIRLDPNRISDGSPKNDPSYIDDIHKGPIHYAKFQNAMRQKKIIQNIELAILNKSRDLLYEQWDKEDAEAAALAELDKQRDEMMKRWEAEDAAGAKPSKKPGGHNEVNTDPSIDR